MRRRGEWRATRRRNVWIIRPPRFLLPLWVVAVGTLARWAWRAGWWCLRHPRLCLAVTFDLWLWSKIGPSGMLAIVAVLIGVSGLWLWWHSPSWWRWVGKPLVGWWRHVFVYRWAWYETMVGCGLSKVFGHDTVVPRLLRVHCDQACDVLSIRMLRGQNPADYARATTDLAYAFGKRHARLYSQRPDRPPVRRGRWAWLWWPVEAVRVADQPSVVHLVLVRTDALRRIVAPFPVPVIPDFTALPMAVGEDLRVWCLHLLATHVLIGGATRRGKGSVLWSLVRAVAGGVSSGLVRLWVIDPKGGMEFAMGRSLFARFACKSFDAMADLLDEAVAVLRERQTRLAGLVRVHTPSNWDPLVVVVIDEMAALTAYLQDGELKKRIAGSLGLLLSQGAGVGVLVVAALQDPRKEVLPFRDLFPTRIALGLTEDSQVDMVLGDGARARGALADQIPHTAKGVGYVLLDGLPEPMRVRFSYISDPEIKAMAAQYAAPLDAADILAQVGRETTPEPVRRLRRSKGPLLPEALRDLLDRDRDGERP
jgi:S-DNA-T family DNA segregation ATPase FtsK/SpoIIIE